MPVRVAVITISDRSSKGERPDLSGPALVNVCHEQGWEIINSEIIPDELEVIKNQLIKWCDNKAVDIILTCGGTGFAPRDVTPEATLSIIQRNAPGLAEAMRFQSMSKTPHAILSRAVTGIRNSTLIINLPGSPHAAVENLSYILNVLPHAVALLQNSPGSEKGH
jgi:molybdopterin adenylyltransferase